MTFQLRPWIDFFRSWAISSKEKVGLDLLAASEDLFATKEFAAFEIAAINAAKVFNIGVTTDPATGRIDTITPPPYVAPARQSPGDFNQHQGDP